MANNYPTLAVIIFISYQSRQQTSATSRRALGSISVETHGFCDKKIFGDIYVNVVVSSQVKRLPSVDLKHGGYIMWLSGDTK